MSELEKRISLYKSTIGQIDKLLEDTEDQEARDNLIMAKAKVSASFEKDVTERVHRVFKPILSAFSEAVTAVADGLTVVGTTLGQLFEMEDD